jgi:hypothetical protein
VIYISSDDSIFISKSTFKVYWFQGDFQGDEDLIGQGKTLEEAVKIAEDYENKMELSVEYVRVT